MDSESRKFTGFSQRTLDFLLKPLQDLVSDLSQTMLTIDPYFEVRPQVDKTISRIYRDTRFSHDKSLFKNNLWITFKRPVKPWQDKPAFYFEIFPDWYRYGMGYYGASKHIMDHFRNTIDENPDRFLKVIDFFKTGIFKLEGDPYKRTIPNDHSGEIQPWYQMKSFYLTCNKAADDVVFSAKLLDELIERFTLLKPLYQYLMEVQLKFGRE